MDDETAHILARSVAPGRSAAVARGDARYAGAAAREPGPPKEKRPDGAVQQPGAAWLQGARRGVAEREGRTIGAVLEDMLAVYEAAGGTSRRARCRRPRRAPGGRASCASGARHRCSRRCRRLAAERGVLVPELIEDLLAREVERLDPHGGKFGVKIAKAAAIGGGKGSGP